MRKLTPQEERIEKAKVLLSEGKVSRKRDGSFKVCSSLEQIFYMVSQNGGWHCTCPDNQFRGCKCKHIWAVEMFEDSKNFSKEVATVASKKQFHAEADVVAVNENDLPKRLGLLLRNGEGQEKWFSMWGNGERLPAVDKGDRISITYVQKPPKKQGGEPFLNILELSRLTARGGEQAEDGINDRIWDQVEKDLAQQVRIRAAVAIKAAAQSGLAQDMDDLFSLAESSYDWLKTKEEAEIAKALRKEVSEEEPGS